MNGRTDKHGRALGMGDRVRCPTGRAGTVRGFAQGAGRKRAVVEYDEAELREWRCCRACWSGLERGGIAIDLAARCVWKSILTNCFLAGHRSGTILLNSLMAVVVTWEYAIPMQIWNGAPTNSYKVQQKKHVG